MKRAKESKKENKGFVLAATVAFIAVLSVFLSLVIMGAALPSSLCAMHGEYKDQMRELEKIGEDFADNSILDEAYDRELYEVETDEISYMEIRNHETGRTLLTVRLENGEIILWKYGDNGFDA